MSIFIKRTKKYFFLWLGLLLFGFFIHYHHYLDSDEGLILAGAWNLINGQKPYIDFFTYLAPGSYYVVFFLWKVFGAHFYVAKIFSIFILSLSALGVFKISRLFSRNKYALISPFLFVVFSISWPLINHNNFSLIFFVWAVYFFLQAGQNSRYSVYYIMAAGALTGGAVWFLQHQGIALFVALSCLLFFNFIKRISLFGKLFILYFFSCFLVVCPLFIFWSADILWRRLIVFPLIHYHEVNQVSPNFFFLFSGITIFLVFTLKNSSKCKRAILDLLFIQLFLLLSALPRPDMGHILRISFPVCALLPTFITASLFSTGLKPLKFLFHPRKSKTIKKRKIFYWPNAKSLFQTLRVLLSISLLSAFAVMAVFLLSFNVYRNSIGFPHQLTGYVKQNCRSPYIYAGPFLPGIYFETQKIPPSPYLILLTGFHPESQFERAYAGLVKHRPDCAILNYKMVEKFNHSKDNPVDRYIAAHYYLRRRFGDTMVYHLPP